MEDQKPPMETLIQRAEEYGKASLELLKLKAIDRSANIASGIVANLVILLLLLLFFFILNIGIALWVGELLGKTFYGFFAVAGFYAVVGGLAYVFKNALIKTPVSNSIVTQALNHT